MEMEMELLEMKMIMISLLLFLISLSSFRLFEPARKYAPFIFLQSLQASVATLALSLNNNLLEVYLSIDVINGTRKVVVETQGSSVQSIATTAYGFVIGSIDHYVKFWDIKPSKILVKCVL
ncbi:hypothetical protein Adt_11505 [Abeliophyllum distichum]|uniref:Uncharacterized protein n=1 Tax=Abeliophyllum distichum TaxID=126358 RepID=A0ABD1UN08_9LAMI